jgi:hypothetical protein
MRGNHHGVPLAASIEQAILLASSWPENCRSGHEEVDNYSNEIIGQRMKSCCTFGQ